MPYIVDDNFLRQLYTSDQFHEIYALVKDQLKEKFPQWSDHLPSNFGMALIEIFCGLTDMMRFMQNVTAVESFPNLARLRESLFRHAKWFSYIPKPAGAARTDLRFTASAGTTATVPKGTKVQTVDGMVTFETSEVLTITPPAVTGTVGAVHATWAEEELVGQSTGGKNQRFELNRSPLVILSGDENPSELPYVRVWVGEDEWTQARSLAWAAEEGGENSEAFKIEIEADDEAYIVFGDGVFGDIPINGANITATYLTGGGLAGNVGPGTLTRLYGNLTNITAVTNPASATGGSNRESEEALRRNIPSQVVTRGRAVTRNDYKRLLEAFGEVAKVNLYHPRENVVEVYVFPEGGGSPSVELLSNLADYLENIRMITEDVRILAPTLVPVDITVKVWCDRGYGPATVAEAVEAALEDDLDEPEFARRVYPSDVYRIVQAVPGVVKIDLDHLAREGDPAQVEAVLCEAKEIVVRGTIVVNVETYYED